MKLRPLATTTIGSFPRPRWLAETDRSRASFRLEGDALREAQDDATLVVLREQEELGLDILTDGEQRREGFIFHMARTWDGIDLVNQAETMRVQLAQLKTVIGDQEAAKPIAASAEALDKQIVALESRLFNMTATGRGQDMLRMPSQLVEKLLHLADVVSLGDFAPTDQALEVHAKLAKDLSGYREQMMRVVSQDVAAFNATLRQHNVAGIVIGQW